ncbi:MAG TPA: hypothetical protein ENI79_04230 [Rhodospirillales bacterium]|nr:hypothetical protein [Rhodospirillales bacterium]
MKKVIGQAAAASPISAFLAWVWNSYNPEHQMPAEVAGALGGLVGPAVAYLVSWLPHPHPDGGA